MQRGLWLARWVLQHASGLQGCGAAPLAASPGCAAAGVAAGGMARLLHTAVRGSTTAAEALVAAPWLAPTVPVARQGRCLSSCGDRRRVAVGVSGGVDSAVAALLLQRQGYDVLGVFMRNWDEGEETGNRNCSVERDLRDAGAVCRQLGIPLHEADFVSQYWNQVFSGFLAQCGRGLTPNPDLACNRHIKFDALLKFAASLGAELVATGHYARLERDGGAAARLLRGADRLKDQSYFLASVQPAALQRVLFPLGHLQKHEVRRLAAEARLATADKRSSAGICFIGRRDFGDFLSQYVPPQPGRYVDVESGADLGPCPDVAAVTHGQRPGIGGAPRRVYAVGKDVVERVVYVAQGAEHPSLLCRTALLRTPHWLSAAHARQLAERGWLACQYKARYGQQPRPCTLHALDRGAAVSLADTAAAAAHAGDCAQTRGAAASPAAAAAGALGEVAAAAGEGAAAAEAAAEEAAHRLGFRPSAYCRLQPGDSRTLPGYLVARFEQPAAAITPQQACVLYDGELCLGTALIAQPGASLHEEAAAAAGRGREACSTAA